MTGSLRSFGDDVDARQDFGADYDGFRGGAPVDTPITNTPKPYTKSTAHHEHRTVERVAQDRDWKAAGKSKGAY